MKRRFWYLCASIPSAQVLSAATMSAPSRPSTHFVPRILSLPSPGIKPQQGRPQTPPFAPPSCQASETTASGEDPPSKSHPLSLLPHRRQLPSAECLLAVVAAPLTPLFPPTFVASTEAVYVVDIWHASRQADVAGPGNPSLSIVRPSSRPSLRLRCVFYRSRRRRQPTAAIFQKWVARVRCRQCL